MVVEIPMHSGLLNVDKHIIDICNAQYLRQVSGSMSRNQPASFLEAADGVSYHLENPAAPCTACLLRCCLNFRSFNSLRSFNFHSFIPSRAHFHFVILRRFCVFILRSTHTRHTALPRLRTRTRKLTRQNLPRSTCTAQTHDARSSTSDAAIKSSAQRKACTRRKLFSGRTHWSAAHSTHAKHA